MKVLSMVVLVGVIIAATCAPAQADTKLPFIKIENLKEGIPVQPGMSQMENKEDGVETVVIVCGDDPDGEWRCERTNYEDGGDCIITISGDSPIRVVGDDC